MKLDLDYEDALDFAHIDDINTARQKLSLLTNMLNKALMDRQITKKAILDECSKFEGMHKLSWDNKIVYLGSIHPETGPRLTDEFNWADTAYRQIKNKQDQVIEDLMALKKQIDFTPR